VPQAVRHSSAPGEGAALHARDRHSEAHSSRVAAIAALFADHLRLPEAEREWIRFGALVHDIGKIGVPDSVLLNPGTLTADEYAVMKGHPVIGRQILGSTLGLPQTVLNIVHFHHERVDGHGCPERLDAGHIPVPLALSPFPTRGMQ